MEEKGVAHAGHLMITVAIAVSCISDSDDDDVDHNPDARAWAAPLGESSSSSEDKNGDVVALRTASAKQTVKWKKTTVKNRRI